MNKKFCLLGLVLSLSVFLHAQVAVNRLVCENLVNPIGIGITNPQFGWQLESGKRGTMQSAYELRVFSDASKPSGTVWTSGKVNSDQSVHVEYAGPKLQSAKKYFWQVRVWDNNGKASNWSETAHWQMGLLEPGDWKAKWIGISAAETDALRPAQLFRKKFNVGKKIKSATAFITSHGMYEAHINGNRVGDYYLTPGWTSYNKRLQYQTYDVSSMVKNGINAIGVTLGSGWYRTNLADRKSVV